MAMSIAAIITFRVRVRVRIKVRVRVSNLHDPRLARIFRFSLLCVPSSDYPPSEHASN